MGALEPGIFMSADSQGGAQPARHRPQTLPPPREVPFLPHFTEREKQAQRGFEGKGPGSSPAPGCWGVTAPRPTCRVVVACVPTEKVSPGDGSEASGTSPPRCVGGR